jgi:hypothetical protein
MLELSAKRKYPILYGPNHLGRRARQKTNYPRRLVYHTILSVLPDVFGERLPPLEL